MKKIAIVTGASSGLGRAISIELAKNKVSTIKGGSELTAFYHLIKNCKDCVHNNSNIDLGVGNENANIVFIPEAIHSAFAGLPVQSIFRLAMILFLLSICPTFHFT